MLSYSLLIILPVVLVGSFAISTLVNSVEENTNYNLEFKGTLIEARESIVQNMNEIKRVTDVLYSDDQLVEYLKTDLESWDSYNATTEYIQPRLKNSINSSRLSLWLSFYIHNTTIPEIYYLHEGSDPLKFTKLVEQFHIRRLENKEWYQNYPEEHYSFTMQWKQIENDAEFNRISLLRRIVDVNPGSVSINEVGFVRVSSYKHELFRSVDYMKINPESAFLVVGENGEIIYKSGQNIVNGAVWTGNKIEGHSVIEEPIPDSEWKLIALVPSDILQNDVNKIRTMMFFISLICFIIFFIIGMLFTRYFTRRVKKIELVLSSFREGEFTKRISEKGNDEFAQIASALNQMGQNTEQLIQEVYLTTIQKKEAELEILQAHINPHFLYNTLSSINRLSKLGESEKLQQMVLDLAKFYRLTLNEGRMIIPIMKEMEHIEAFINIQKIKYAERLSVQYDIQPDIYKFQTIKIIVQPLIENVLEHAWFGDRIHIRIVGYLENDIITFKIIDDGVGMPPHLIDEILDLNGNVGYGIRNVNQRIKLHFGSEYGLSICSRLGMGTSVVIQFPAYKQPIKPALS
jgi:two-component system, sensor histidine kinase YesM